LEINLFQIQYDAQSKPDENAEILAFDCRDQPEVLKREMAHMIRFYEQIVSQGDAESFFSLLSPKFSQKMGLNIEQLKQHMHAHANQDIYIFNPYPKHVYSYLNVVEHGETFHPGLKKLFKDLFIKADINFDVERKFRNGNDSACYCNYWVAKKKFWDHFIPLVKKLDQVIENMSPNQKKQYFSNTQYIVEACFYPFIFERLLSIFLVMNRGRYLVQDYVLPRHEVQKNNYGRVFNSFYYNHGKYYFDFIEKNSDDIEYIDQQLKKLRTFFNVKVERGPFYFFRKLQCSIMKNINCFYIIFYLKSQFKMVKQASKKQL
jgi:hypothetical protein